MPFNFLLLFSYIKSILPSTKNVILLQTGILWVNRKKKITFFFAISVVVLQVARRHHTHHIHTKHISYIKEGKGRGEKKNKLVQIKHPLYIWFFLSPNHMCVQYYTAFLWIEWKIKNLTPPSTSSSSLKCELQQGAAFLIVVVWNCMNLFKTLIKTAQLNCSKKPRIGKTPINWSRFHMVTFVTFNKM